MHVTYTLDEQDYVDFNLFHMRTSKTAKRAVFIQRIIGPIIFMMAIYAAYKLTEIPIWYWTAIMSVLSILWYVFYPKRIEKDIKRNINKMLGEDDNKALLGKQTIKLTGQCVTQTNDYESKSVKWQTFNKIEQTKDHLFIYDSSITAFIIPKSAFESSEESYQFYIHIKGKINE